MMIHRIHEGALSGETAAGSPQDCARHLRGEVTLGEEKAMKILIVITSPDQLGNTGRKTASGSKSSQLLITLSRMPSVEIALAS